MSFLGILFPERCYKCHIRGVSLCKRCATSLSLAPPLPPGTFAVYNYGQRLVQDAVWQLKYHTKSELAHALALHAAPYIAEYLGYTVQSHQIEKFVFVPIPQFASKQRSKGFNQAALLALWWSAAFPHSRVAHLLIKTKQTLPQARLDKVARTKNVAHSMQSRPLDPRLIYIIVDDVTTTGSTFTEATRALRVKGARNICCIALAHGYKSGNKKGHH